MADSADIANDAYDTHLQATIQRKIAQAQIDAPGNKECDDCGLDIPEQRREIAPSAKTCIECQSIRETKQRHIRH